ncbi:MAG: threonine aldolase family protein [Parafannyhessea sp.]|uniref:threonine aldolase family protein n=1 Tax=Parafannyhessea sp. TaxID=2847324 RepID=UPI003F06EFB2
MHMLRNDYSEGAAPQILQALVDTNAEQCVGYTEGDPHCERARKLIREACGLLEDEADVEFCVGGTSANVIALSGMLRDWEGVICTPDAHIVVHETGALAATGRTPLPTRDADGFLSPAEAERVWRFQTSTGRHMTRPAAVYVTDTTEVGGVWTRERLDAICDWAHGHGLTVFLDGARLASALTSSENDLTLEHIAHTVDAFYLGGTKNGMLFGEAMVIRDPRLREAFPYLQKERGGLMAKGRLLGVQFEAALDPANADQGGEVPYWRLARHANALAGQLRDGLVALGYEPYGHSASNQQFFAVTPEQQAAFEQAVGCETFYVLDDGRRVVRFVTSWASEEQDVLDLLALAKRVA